MNSLHLHAPKYSINNQIDDSIRLQSLHLNTSIDPNEISIWLEEGWCRPEIIQSIWKNKHVNTREGCHDYEIWLTIQSKK